ncbi:biogenesis protein MshI [Marinobacter pelagius]|uniref:MSHA biogenesis protein MshI n=1 Tax=Marinobacter pelagius TaxID=379482 RepID=A0A1I4YUV2_9GAMM|nr:biogenesis protein MshI [Marinobacter pelagius]SFN41410.1 MSHA biogenesis protein MshI [Marinobacter pelagius]
MRVALEVRPDGIAWSVAPASPAQQLGFVECPSARRAEVLGSLVGELGWSGALADLVLPMEQYQVFQMERPAGLDDAELADALKWKLRDLLEFSPADAISDVFPFPADAARGRGELVNVVAARKSLLKELVALVQQSGLKPGRIDIAELALRNLAARLDPDSKGAALVHLRQSYGQMIICRGQTLYLSRRLDVSASGLRDAARQESVVQALALEMQRSLDYYESQMGQVPPAHIHLVAKDRDLPLASMLSSYLAAGVSNLDWAALGLESAVDSRCLPAWSAGLPLVGERGK